MKRNPDNTVGEIKKQHIYTLLGHLNIIKNCNILVASDYNNSIKSTIEKVYRIKPYYYSSNVEIEENCDELRCLGNSFLNDNADRYDIVVGIPPMDMSLDVNYSYKMFNQLKSGGRVGIVMSNKWRHSNYKKFVDFRSWLSSKEFNVYFFSDDDMLDKNILIIDKN